MRRTLVDHARADRAQKRGDGRNRITLHEDLALVDHQEIDVLALDEALSRLAELDERKSRVVELRFFAGLKMDEVATALGTSLRTVEADWYFARAWLRAELRDFDPGE